MGLDITVYREVAITEPHEREDDCWEQNHFLARNPHVRFERHLEGLEAGRCYVPVLPEGERVEVDGLGVMGFRAGSYGGYNGWRNVLSLAALGVPPSEVWDLENDFTGAAFESLIDFSDCEGVIGPVYCAKLARDFKEHRERVIENSGPSPADLDDGTAGYFLEKYDAWTQAFEMAADTGVVLFH